jgi:hypothetical protein
MGPRNRKTGLARLEKTHSSPATLPDLQAQGQNSGPKESMSVIASGRILMFTGKLIRTRSQRNVCKFCGQL